MVKFQELINKSIKNFRLSLGMSQEKFCEKCGFTVDNYRNLEYNRHCPKASTVDKICKTFSINPYELLKYGLDKTSIKASDITTSLSDLSQSQLNFVSEFIRLLRKFDI